MFSLAQLQEAIQAAVGLGGAALEEGLSTPHPLMGHSLGSCDFWFPSPGFSHWAPNFQVLLPPIPTWLPDKIQELKLNSRQ